MMAIQNEIKAQVIPPREKPKQYLMTVDDDSMSPLLMIGDDLYYELGVVDSGEVGIFSNVKTGQVIVRKGECVDGKWFLIACNPDYPVIQVDNETNEWHCFGKVVAQGRKVNKGDW